MAGDLSVAMKDCDACPIYRCGRRRYWLDRSRQRLVRLADEEKVRYHAVAAIAQEYGYPSSWIHTEIPVQDGNRRRADILVKPEGAQCALIVIECKKRGLELTAAHKEQVLDYCYAAGAPYMVLTNGREKRVWIVDHDSHRLTPIGDVPSFRELSESHLNHATDLCTVVCENDGSEDAYSIATGIGSGPAALDLARSLHERITASSSVFAEPFKWRNYTIAEDMGVGARSLGRIRGCWWNRGYRSVLALDPEGNACVVRFKVGADSRAPCTYLYVAVSVGARNQCTLAMCLDDPVQAEILEDLMHNRLEHEFFADMAVDAIERRDCRSRRWTRSRSLKRS
ncbi:MAG TPA: type I restriction enzyme HsdR N-terminal domain-containing protein [Clostridiales bacterium]|nr:type I restriction enzyme HsdR N-terminal domain-containing protein [Clostridiales bacterium]